MTEGDARPETIETTFRTMLEPPPLPTQTDLDALFAEARSARVLEGGVRSGKPVGDRVLATFEGRELDVLRAALRVAPPGPPFHCMCDGDLAIELRGRLLRVGAISFHHGQSIRLDAQHWDAALADGPALLRLLRDRGHPELLAAFEAAEKRGEVARDDRARWFSAAPAPLAPLLAALSTGPMGLPRHEFDPGFDAAVEATRSAGLDDRALALALFAWLGGTTSPFSGYPAYEDVALVLGRKLRTAAVLEAVASVEGAGVLGAARYVADHPVVSFRKRFLRAIPDVRFVELEEAVRVAPIESEGHADALARIRRAREVAAAERARPAELSREASQEVAVVALSDDGPFRSLVTDGTRLAAMDVYTVVGIEPDDGETRPITVYEGSPFTELVFAGEGLLALRGNEGRLDRLSLDGGERVVCAQGLLRPLSPVASGGIVCFVSAPFEERDAGGYRTSVQRTSLARIDASGHPVTIAPIEGGIASLAADDTHLYFATTDLERAGTLSRVARDGGPITQLAGVRSLGHAMAQPAIVAHDGWVHFADGRSLMRVAARGGEAETVHRAARKIAAIACLTDAFVLIVGDMSDDAWDVVRVDARGGARTLRTLRRRPYDRLGMVVARGAAYFTLDQRLYRVR